MRVGSPRRALLFGSLSVALLAFNCLGCAVTAQEETAQDTADAANLDPLDLLRTGRYDDLIARVERETGEERTSRSIRALADAYAARGRYDDEIALLEAAHARDPELGTRLGQALLHKGSRARAQELFENAVASGQRDALTARYALGTLVRDRGDIDGADQHWYALIDAYNARARLSARELVAVGRAVEALGRNDPQLFKDAVKAYDEAIDSDPADLVPRVALGELFVEKYDSTQARDALRDVLQVAPNHPDANLAMARALHFDGSPEALVLVEKVLEVNPNHTAARVFMSLLRVELEQFDKALLEARAALKVDPGSLPAMTALAAVLWKRDEIEDFEKERDRILAIDPHHAPLFTRLAEVAERTANYRAARDWAAEGTKLDAKSWKAHHQLGMNQLRLGEIEMGTASLERAFAGDPYNVWVKNTLDLIDTFDQYESRSDGRFEIFAHQREADLLEPYYRQLAEEAWASMVERYGYEPPSPIRIEIYPSHADFSVRTVGLAGLGALGVCFGPVLAVDSPSARSPGEANWGSTLWHELSHTFTLEMTRSRVPRWLTEGTAVWEERNARQGWGDDVQPQFLEALAEGKLLGMAEINNGFVRPEFPTQIVLSYLQGSLVVERIVDLYGFPKLVEMLHAYRDGGETAEVFETVLGLDLETFDEQFFGWLEKRYAKGLAALAEKDGDEPPRATSPEEAALMMEKRAAENPDDWRAQMAWGSWLVANQRREEAISFLERARDLFPEYATEGSAYRILATTYRTLGNTDAAIEALEAVVAVDETSYVSHLELAELYESVGRLEDAARVLERTVYAYPMERELHERRAALAEQSGDAEILVGARLALFGLAPPDRAGALYELALAQRDANQLRDARRSVLRALEIAPGFAKAQKLLVELRALSAAEKVGSP